ncbi:MAG: MarR family transcriptional regulator [Chloroflexi bacterium]|nr:MarR family transcriptional regulator [Chloroflexota bacterium]
MPTHYTGDERIRRALDAYIKLSRARKTMGMLTGRLLADYNLTESQLGTLESLYYLGPMSQKDIGDKMLVTGGNMTMVVKNLQKRGLVCRERDEDDRRQFIVSLTPEGRQLLDELFPRHVEYISELMSILTPEEMDRLGELCKMLGLQSRED